MKENTPFDAETMLEEAKTSEHQEAYRTLERKSNYRIGVGVRLTPPNPPTFFIEILVYLCPQLQQCRPRNHGKESNLPQEVESKKLRFNVPRRQLCIMRSDSACSENSRRIAEVKALMQNSFK